MVGCADQQTPAAGGDDDFRILRERMVTGQLLHPSRGITDPAVAEAMREVPRHEFVPAAQQLHAYEDTPLPIGHGQTISQPYIVAFMTEKLEVKPGLKILEIGTGSGYQAAVLAAMGARVYSMEIVEPLAQSARAALDRTGYSDVHTMTGDGFRGWPEHAPFDRIIVTCSPEDIPPPLPAQLAEGGRMMIPVGDRYGQQLYLLEKRAGKIEQQAVLPVRFVPMTGTAEDR
jgi:protein-L-isoaspartate(D-aspartate) O-methyltransferase